MSSADPELLESMVAMGYDRDKAARALQKTDNKGIEEAIEVVDRMSDGSGSGSVVAVSGPAAPAGASASSAGGDAKGKAAVTERNESEYAQDDESMGDSDSEVFYMSDDDDDFAPTAPAADAKTAPDYKILTPVEIRSTQIRQINQIKDIFQIPPTIARQLLQHFHWESERLIERYYGGEGEQIYEDAKIANPNKDGQPEDVDPEKEFQCEVCLDLHKHKNMAGLPCNHIFCKECWDSYLRVMINDGKATHVKCPAYKCGLLVDEVTVTNLLSDESVAAKYDMMIAKSFVMDHPRVTWCPAPGCENAIQVPVYKSTPVKCACGFVFCFACSQPNHQPARCEMVKEWGKKIQDDSETENWLALYTKECPNPKCQAVINKDEGCQYMTCAVCKYKFCWICCGNFDHKKHNCNQYKEEASQSKTAARNALNKFNFFFTRYSLHARSGELEEKLEERAKEIMKEMEEEMSWIHVQYIQDATDTLKHARAILKNSYIFGFYLPEEVNRDLFEYLQGEFEEAVEKLSGILEAKTDEKRDRQFVIDLTQNVKRRLENFVTGIESGDIEGGAGASDEKVYDGPAKVTYSGWIYNAN